MQTEQKKENGLALPKKKRKMSLWARQEERAGYLYLLPAFVGLVFLTYVPLIADFVLSFFRWEPVNFNDPFSFVGFKNYTWLFSSAASPLWESLKVTVIFSIFAVLGSLIYSLIIAMLLNRKIPARGFFRALFYLPYILPAAAVYVGWSWLYEPNFGPLAAVLKSMGIQNALFLSSEQQALPSLVVIAVWLSGNLIVIFLAGLQNVPRVYHEAAEIDGANAWQRFRHVTVPSMTPIIFYNLLMALITNMQIVTPALSLTKEKTPFLTYEIYMIGIGKTGGADLGRSSALAFISFVIIGIFTAIVFATSNSWVYYEGGD